MSCNLRGLNWHDLPNLKQGVKECHAACPFNGGKDRIVIWPDGTQDNPRPRLWCRQCNYGYGLSPDGTIGNETVEKKRAYRPVHRPLPEPRIAQHLADYYHGQINEFAYEYYESRGISRKMADMAKLGWREMWTTQDGKTFRCERFSIPGFYNGKLYGIQYRASREGQKRYFTEPNSINQILFNTAILDRARGFYVLIVESPLDALALTSHGYPAVAPFDGNAKGSWKDEWTVLLKGIPERIIIPDNDGRNGETLAEDKHGAIPGSTLHWLPSEFKDTGKLMEADPRGERLNEWLQRWPPILGV